MSDVYAIRDEEGNLVNPLTGEPLLSDNLSNKDGVNSAGVIKLAIEDMNPKLIKICEGTN